MGNTKKRGQIWFLEDHAESLGGGWCQMTYIFEDRKGHRIYVFSPSYRMDEESRLNMYGDGTLRDSDKEYDLAARKARYIAKHPNK